MSFNINLPSINGELEAGITIGVDSSLPDEKKLPILTLAGKPAAIEVVKQHAAVWAFAQHMEARARRLLVNGVIGLIDTGCLCYTGEDRSLIPDGDWRFQSTTMSPTQDVINAVQALCSVEDIGKAVTVAIATKANFWLMNHHTGQGNVVGYVKKVLEVFYGAEVLMALVEAAHSLGHFCSTLKILSLANIAGLREVRVLIQATGSSVKLSADTTLRFSSMPAGTHRLAVAFEAARRLVRSSYAPFCPDVQDFRSIPEVRDSVMTRPASYHIGASYLTGLPRADYQDTDNNAYLGRLGTYIQVLYKKSTLARSPHMQIDRVEGYDDYDPEFKGTLTRIQAAQAMARGKILEEQAKAFQQAPEEVMRAVRAKYAPVRR